tara:strand:- start:647 stop:1006 length:360 start_codon:yes stop_codon:yes gene_type:complete
METVTEHHLDDLSFIHHNKMNRWAEVNIEVEWQHVDNSFDHAFGLKEQWDYEWVDYYILSFIVYDEEGEVLGEFNFEEYERYDVEIFNGMDLIWKTYSSSIIDLVVQELDRMDPPDDDE